MLKLDYKGGKYTVNELAEMSGIPGAVIRYRLREGYEVEEAIKDQPLKVSIKRFTDASDWQDWVGKNTQEVYNDYFHFCQKEKLAAENKVQFVRQVLSVYPFLESVPNKREHNNTVRIFKLVEYDRINTLD